MERERERERENERENMYEVRREKMPFEWRSMQQKCERPHTELLT